MASALPRWAWISRPPTWVQLMASMVAAVTPTARRGQADGERGLRLAERRAPRGLLGPPESAHPGARPDRARPEAQSAARRHDPVHPRASAKVSGPLSDFAKNMVNAPGHLVTTAESVGFYHHSVIFVSLIVSDAGRLCKRYRPESASNLAGTCPPLCWFRCLSPMLGQSPTAG